MVAIMQEKKKMSVKNIIILSIMAVIAIGIAALLLYFNSVNQYKKSVASISITNVDLNKIPDGSYIGDCDVDFIYAKVKVTVVKGTITNIDLLEHKNERGSKAETITDDIVREQKINVDTVSGATNSSKVIMQAVENALLQKE